MEEAGNCLPCLLPGRRYQWWGVGKRWRVKEKQRESKSQGAEGDTGVVLRDRVNREVVDGKGWSIDEGGRAGSGNHGNQR